jgi:hypothetical protein
MRPIAIYLFRTYRERSLMPQVAGVVMQTPGSITFAFVSVAASFECAILCAILCAVIPAGAPHTSVAFGDLA